MLCSSQVGGAYLCIGLGLEYVSCQPCVEHPWSACSDALNAMGSAQRWPASGQPQHSLPRLLAGGLELFLRPPGLRVQALQLLHLLLEEPALAAAFEASLAAAAGSSGQESETPQGSGGSGPGGGRSSLADASTGPSRAPSHKGGADQEGAAEPMQLDAAEPHAAPSWAGAPAVLRRVLQSLSLAPGQPQPQPQQGPQQQQQQQQQPAAGGGHEAPAKMPGAAGAGGAAAGPAAGGGGPCAAARQALKLVAMLRERRAQGILLALLQGDDGCEGLCQRLVALVAAATVQQGPDAATSPLLPAQCPAGAGDLSSGSAAEAAAAALAWQQLMRVAQEALTLLRGLSVDEALGAHSSGLAGYLPAWAASMRRGAPPGGTLWPFWPLSGWHYPSPRCAIAQLLLLPPLPLLLPQGRMRWRSSAPPHPAPASAWRLWAVCSGWSRPRRAVLPRPLARPQAPTPAAAAGPPQRCHPLRRCRSRPGRWPLAAAARRRG